MNFTKGSTVKKLNNKYSVRSVPNFYARVVQVNIF